MQPQCVNSGCSVIWLPCVTFSEAHKTSFSGSYSCCLHIQWWQCAALMFQRWPGNIDPTSTIIFLVMPSWVKCHGIQPTGTLEFNCPKTTKHVGETRGKSNTVCGSIVPHSTLCVKWYTLQPQCFTWSKITWIMCWVSVCITGRIQDFQRGVQYTFSEEKQQGQVPKQLGALFLQKKNKGRALDSAKNKGGMPGHPLKSTPVLDTCLQVGKF